MNHEIHERHKIKIKDCRLQIQDYRLKIEDMEGINRFWFAGLSFLVRGK